MDSFKYRAPHVFHIILLIIHFTGITRNACASFSFLSFESFGSAADRRYAPSRPLCSIHPPLLKSTRIIFTSRPPISVHLTVTSARSNLQPSGLPSSRRAPSASPPPSRRESFRAIHEIRGDSHRGPPQGGQGSPHFPPPPLEGS